jgi:hypothetical protein
MDDASKKITKAINDFHNIIKESEKKTLGKISDCEKLLHVRVSQDYVDTSSKQLEEKLIREF